MAQLERWRCSNADIFSPQRRIFQTDGHIGHAAPKQKRRPVSSAAFLFPKGEKV